MIAIHRTPIENCLTIKYSQYKDHRGHFSELFKQSWLPDFKPVQSNLSFSKQGVLRGIHRTPYAKLVTCVSGSIFDVCVDLRPDSITYGQYYSIILSADSGESLYIPPYCGHGFYAYQDSIVLYHQNDEYHSSKDETYCYKLYNIPWPLNDKIIISDKDSNACCE